MMIETRDPMELPFEDFINVIRGLEKTCSADELEDYGVTFIKNEEWLVRIVDSLRESNKQIVTMCATQLMPIVQKLEKNLVSRMKPFYFIDVERKFIRIHNFINEGKPPRVNLIAPTAISHPTALVGADAMRIVYDPASLDKPMKMKHMGNVVIGEGVEIGPNATIHRASLGSTIIGDHNHIGSYVNIGHNVRTGKYCAFTPYACVGGSTRIGDNVLVGMQTVIRDNLRICSEVKIGQGSNVVKSIDEPGLYYGSPATRKGDWDGRW
jgi:acetyltransferase-like isoleucine patch superfamily enzyme